MKTVVYLGHLSRFGLAFGHRILSSQYFKVECMVLGSEGRWWAFKQKLEGTGSKQDYAIFERDYKYRTRKLMREWKVKFPSLRIRIVDDLNSPEELGFITGFDVALCAAFPQIFSHKTIAAIRGNIINFHPSYLPRCRGAHPIYWTIASGEKFGGVSSHYMTNQIDAGPVIARVKISFEPDSITYEDLYYAAVDRIGQLIDMTETQMKLHIDPTEQNEQEATYFKNDRAYHRKIYWKMESADAILRKIRAGGAYNFRPGGRIIFFGAPAKLVAADIYLTNHFEDIVLPGTVLSVYPRGAVIKTRDGVIKTNFYQKKSVEVLLYNVLERFGLSRLKNAFDALRSVRLGQGETLL